MESRGGSASARPLQYACTSQSPSPRKPELWGRLAAGAAVANRRVSQPPRRACPRSFRPSPPSPIPKIWRNEPNSSLGCRLPRSRQAESKLAKRRHTVTKAVPSPAPPRNEPNFPLRRRRSHSRKAEPKVEKRRHAVTHRHPCRHCRPTSNPSVRPIRQVPNLSRKTAPKRGFSQIPQPGQ